jgi:DNA-binding response OmpR family regulator
VSIAPDEELISIEVSTSDEILEEMAEDQDQGASILVVDDEEDIVRMLEKALQKDGFRVLVARRGLEALQAVKAHAPDLVLLDAMLPEIHGFEICKKIKSSKRFGHIPVIMISAVYRGWRYALDAKEAYGADDYFEKPFRLVPLVRRVRELLNASAPSVVESEVDPDAANEAYGRGVAFYREKRYEEAEAALLEARQLDPFSANVHYALANVLLARNRLYEAMREYEQTIELAPELFAPLRNLAILYQKKGFRNKAVEMWERALRCSPEGEREQVREQLLKLL